MECMLSNNNHLNINKGAALQSAILGYEAFKSVPETLKFCYNVFGVHVWVKIFASGVASKIYPGWSVWKRMVWMGNLQI